jgi:hypothetical protein
VPQVRSMLTEQRLQALPQRKVDLDEIIQWLCKVGGRLAG